MFCRDCIRDWKAERALVSLAKDGLCRVLLMWVVQGSDLEWQKGAAALGAESQEMLSGESSITWTGWALSISLLWAGGASVPTTAHTCSWAIFRRCFSIAWKGFGFFLQCREGRRLQFSLLLSVQIWITEEQVQNWTNWTKTLPSHFLFQVAKNSCSSPVSHLLLFSESHKSVQGRRAGWEPEAELQPQPSKHWRFLPLPLQSLHLFCSTHSSGNTFTLLQTGR